MNTKIIDQVQLGEFVVFASLPDMGRVGGIVSSYLALILKARLVAEFSSSDKPWVLYSDGLAKTVRDIYRLYCYEGQYGKLAIFSGESQPQDAGELYRLCSSLFDVIQ